MPVSQKTYMFADHHHMKVEVGIVIIKYVIMHLYLVKVVLRAKAVY